MKLIIRTVTREFEQNVNSFREASEVVQDFVKRYPDPDMWGDIHQNAVFIARVDRHGVVTSSTNRELYTP